MASAFYPCVGLDVWVCIDTRPFICLSIWRWVGSVPFSPHAPLLYVVVGQSHRRAPSRFLPPSYRQAELSEVPPCLPPAWSGGCFRRVSSPVWLSGIFCREGPGGKRGGRRRRKESWKGLGGLAIVGAPIRALGRVLFFFFFPHLRGVRVSGGSFPCRTDQSSAFVSFSRVWSLSFSLAEDKNRALCSSVWRSDVSRAPSAWGFRWVRD